MRTLKDEVIESYIIKGICVDKRFLSILLNTFPSKFFENDDYKKIYECVVEYYKKYYILPDKEIIKEITNIDLDLCDFDTNKNFDFLVDETNYYLKEKSIKDSIMKSIDIMDKNEDSNQIRELITDALSKDLKIDLGLDYWNTCGERLKNILLRNEVRIPSYFPQLDEYINNGFPPYTLSIILSKIHGCKTNIMINMMQRMSLHNKNSIIFSLEMGEEALAQRLDAINSLTDINSIYNNTKTIKKLGRDLKTVKEKKVGKIVLKEFPTGAASTAHFRNILREYSYRGIKFDVIFCDYITLMQPEYKNLGNLYQDGKRISEELRALSLEFQSPVISVSQINREGSFCEFKSLDMNHIGESLGIAASADFMMIMGKDNEELVYESEISYKILKNRLGGRIGEINKFYLDQKSLKMYDAVELNTWLDDAKKSNDERKIFNDYN